MSQGEDAYLGWEDLLDETPAEPDQSLPTVAGTLFAGDASPDPLALAIPEEVQALLEQQRTLENNLKALVGEGEQTLDDIRREKCFPVRAHTKESRIEDRRLNARDENLRMQKRARQARKSAEQRIQEQHNLQRELQNRERLAATVAQRRELLNDAAKRSDAVRELRRRQLAEAMLIARREKQHQEQMARRVLRQRAEAQARAEAIAARKRALLSRRAERLSAQEREDRLTQARIAEQYKRLQQQRLDERRLWDTREAVKQRRLNEALEQQRSARVELVRERRLEEMQDERKAEQRDSKRVPDKEKAVRHTTTVRARRERPLHPHRLAKADTHHNPVSTSRLSQRRRDDERDEKKRERALELARQRRNDRWA